HTRAPAPRPAPATVQLARALVESKRSSEALPLLTDFKQKYPNSKLIPHAQFLLGQIKYTNWHRQGGLAQSASFVAANPAPPDAPEARRLLAQGLAKYGDRAQPLQA